MEHSHRFFENKDCKYYPCHKGVEEFNCLFCYCPMYTKEKCPGSPKYSQKEDRIIKVCTDCNFPHRPENYEVILRMLRGEE